MRAHKKTDYAMLPDFLREMREAAGISQRALGSLMNQPQPWVHKNETGIRRVDLPEFIRWCQVCGVDPVDAVKKYIRSLPS